MNTFTRTLSRVLTLTALALSTHLVDAATPERDTSATIRVRYDDLNLSAPTGVETLTRRIQNAAQVLCGDNTGDPIGALRRRACIRDAMDTALAQVRLPGN